MAAGTLGVGMLLTVAGAEPAREPLAPVHLSAAADRSSAASSSLDGVGVASTQAGGEAGVRAAAAQPRDAHAPRLVAAAGSGSSADAGATARSPELTAVVLQYCTRCHSDRRLSGNMSLEDFDMAEVASRAERTEKMITKLRLGMMPPPGAARPPADTLMALVETLERTIDETAAAAGPAPGRRLPQRLNRAEYEATIEALLGLDVDAGAFLPPETISDNFDNIADVQNISSVLLEGYMRAAARVARLAVGDPEATPVQTRYTAIKTRSQLDPVEGAPYGSRGGISVIHTFPADGEYVFQLELHREVEDFLFGRTARDERLEVSIDGERVALLEVDRWMSEQDPQGLLVDTDPVFVRAGPKRVSAVFIPTFEGPVNDLMAPIEHTMADTWIGRDLSITTLPHLRDLGIIGPHNATGVSPTPSRARIFTCRPLSSAEELPCAEEITRRIAENAYRRPLTDQDVEGLMGLYEHGAEEGGFEVGIRTVLQGILSSPFFVFRYDRQPEDVAPGEVFPIPDAALASRLSYFLWAEPPDDELRMLAEQGVLQERQVLARQVGRMLDDPRSEALATRFAAQWLRLPRLDVIHPDPRRHPEFDDRLRDAMRRETELVFDSLVRRDGSLLELLDSDFTFVNERLARHYGIQGVVGPEFRAVPAPERRRGILGHAGILTLTSHANRTSPVDRGKWVMEVLLGVEPPPPPPNVPDLEVTEVEDPELGRNLTVRERLEKHRSNPSCNSCHQFIDPLGLPLENWSATGLWRIRDQGTPVDTRGELWNGRPVETPQDLREALLDLEVPVVRNFTENLLRYAIGRRVLTHDKPTVRKIASDAAAEGYRMSSFILGVVMSDPFRLSSAEARVTDDDPAEGAVK